MSKVYIDGVEYEVSPGRNMLEAALDNGLNLPYFCWHPAMGSIGACRLCAVRVYKDENDTKGKIMMACMTPAKEGTRISMNDPEAAEFRRYVIEWLMINHPHDCPVCDEGGECHLQDMTAMCGQVYRRFRFKKRTYRDQYLGPFVTHEMNRCIQCYRCLRFYRDLAGGRDFNVFGSKNRLYFGRDKDGVLQSEFSGNLVEVCPTGVFTDKTLYRHYTRKWDLETAPSVCVHCGLGCNTIPGVRYKKVRRIRARYNSEVNGYFLCDRGRYGYEFINSEIRIRRPKVASEGGLAKASWHEAAGIAHDMLRDANGVVGIGSPRASLESNYSLKKLVGEDNFSTGLSEPEHKAAELALSILKEGPARTPSLSEVERADAVIVIGADPTHEAPMMDFAIRQAMRKAPLDAARKLKIPDWDANAVANVLQNAKGKLHIAVPWAVKIEEISASAFHAAPPEIIKFIREITDYVISDKANEENPAYKAAADLKEAAQPLVVTSISSGTDTVKAAANLAWELCRQGKDCWLSILVPETNTMGAAMLGGMDVQEALERIESGKADTLVVMENDLARRVSPNLLENVLGRVTNLVILDTIETGLLRRADVVLPSAAWAESDGTFINNECRAQRFFQVFVPEGEIKYSWQAIQCIANTKEWHAFEDVLQELAEKMPEFAPALDAAPSRNWRDPAGRKIARMPHRYSGRTAENADVTVAEPRPPEDPETPFTFSMEGDQNPQPGPLVPRYWYPGWNSENAVNKFQIEVGGPLHGGEPGRRLIEPSGRQTRPLEITKENQSAGGESWVVPRPEIFGSDELSRFSRGIAELTPPAEISINPEYAKKLQINEGQLQEFAIGGQVIRLPVKYDESIADGVISIPAGFPQTMGILAPAKSTIAGAE